MIVDALAAIGVVVAIGCTAGLLACLLYLGFAMVMMFFDEVDERIEEWKRRRR